MKKLHIEFPACEKDNSGYDLVENGLIIGVIDEKRKAEYIVQACNEYQALKEENERVCERMEDNHRQAVHNAVIIDELKEENEKLYNEISRECEKSQYLISDLLHQRDELVEALTDANAFIKLELEADGKIIKYSKWEQLLNKIKEEIK